MKVAAYCLGAVSTIDFMLARPFSNGDYVGLDTVPIYGIQGGNSNDREDTPIWRKKTRIESGLRNDNGRNVSGEKFMNRRSNGGEKTFAMILFAIRIDHQSLLTRTNRGESAKWKKS
jgi:hypothetical protein